MLPSIWLWIFVVAMFITRMLVRSQPVVRSLLWLLNIDEKPFRSAGAVAAALVFAVLALLGAARAIAT
jgi:hypothetical protein